MNRRNFLKQLSFVAAGATLGHAGLLSAQRHLIEPDGATDLALRVLTDQSDLAISRVQDLLRTEITRKQTLKFDEMVLPGVHAGDIVLIRNQGLVNIHEPRTAFEQQLDRLAKELRLPREIENPVLLKFSTGNKGQTARKISVYRGQRRIGQYDLHDRIQDEKLTGTKGPVYLTLSDGRAHISGASCKHKTCMQMGSIHETGQSLVCVPNQLRVTIEGESRYGIDGLLF